MDRTQSTAILIADLGYGDAGKGSIVDALARSLPVHSVVRYNGGAQAAHNVVTSDGRQHTFAQFGSATFLPGVRTYLSRYMLVHPLAMLAEERHLRALGVRDAFERTSLERGALIITPYQQAANRLRELARGDARHGSCGLGVGETMADSLSARGEALVAGDLADRAATLRKLHRVREQKLVELAPIMAQLAGSPQAEQELRLLQDPQMVEQTADLFGYFAGRVAIVDAQELGRLLNQPAVTLFEGAQGVLLDEWWGFYPYNSWSTLTFANAGALLEENQFDGQVQRLGLMRGYATRHGAGPFVSEDAGLTALLPDAHNVNNPWQQGFRVGQLDLLALRYALDVTGGVDGLVVTNLDRMAAIKDWQVCSAYRYPGPETDLAEDFDLQDDLVAGIRLPADPTNLSAQEWLTQRLLRMQPVLSAAPGEREHYLEAISSWLGAPVVMTSAGPTALEKTRLSLAGIPLSLASTLDFR